MMTYLRDTIRLFVQPLRYFYFKRILKVNLHNSTIVSYRAFIDKTTPHLITIGKDTIIGGGAVILSHDYSRALSKPTNIGDNCFLGVNCVILPGVRIGNEVVIGAGAIVTHDIESNSLAAGNPARIMKKIKTGPYGRIIAE